MLLTTARLTEAHIAQPAVQGLAHHLSIEKEVPSRPNLTRPAQTRTRKASTRLATSSAIVTRSAVTRVVETANHDASEQTPAHQPCQSGGLVEGQSAFRNAGISERHARLRALLQLDLATVQHDLKVPVNVRIKEDFAFEDLFGKSLKKQDF